MLDKLGRKGEAATGVGLPLIPMARPDNGAKTDNGDTTLLGLSRAERLKGGPYAQKLRKHVSEPDVPCNDFC